MSSNDTKGSTKNGSSSTSSVSGKKHTVGMFSSHGGGAGQQTGTFHEESETVLTGMEAFRDPTFADGAQSQVSLGEFLARPVQLYLTNSTTPAYAWTVGAGVVGSSLIAGLDPWLAWQAIPSIKEKLKYFAYMQGELHVKFVVAGTPFHYGRVQVAYIPFGTTDTIFANMVANALAIGVHHGEASLMHMSTMLSAEIDPNTNESVELVLPYVNFKNWMSVAVPESLGVMHLTEMAPLTRASTEAVTVVNITCFAWMEKVVLSTPTIATATSGKEQPIPPSVSAVASAVAAGSGKLEHVPVIGRFAKATSIASGAVGSIASLFGFSRPIDIKSPQLVSIRGSDSMACTQGLSNAVKLTLDPLQEITLDPGTIGLSDADEMSFKSIVERECWLATVVWGDTGGPFNAPPAGYNSNLLFASNVTPDMVKRIGTLVGVNGTYQMSIPTPMSFVARVFNFWRGTIVYRFRVVASTFHKGFLKVTYDPLSADLANITPGSALAASNLQMTQFLDLTTGREIIVRIPWSSQYPYLQVGTQLHDTPEQYSPSIAPATTNFAKGNFNVTRHNGHIQLSIVNKLVAPNAQPAYILVSSWMEDAEFQCPSIRINQDGALYIHPGEGLLALGDEGSERINTPTSGMESVAAPPTVTTEVDLVNTSKSLKMSQICFGEEVSSVRALMKRFSLCYIGTWDGTSSTGNITQNVMCLPQHPMFQNVDVTDLVKAMKVSYLSYFSGAYGMRRGAVRYKTVWQLGPEIASGLPETYRDQTCIVTRTWDAVSPGLTGAHITAFGYTLDSYYTQPAAGTRVVTSGGIEVGYEGTHLFSTPVQDKYPTFEIPYYGATRFSQSRYQSLYTAGVAPCSVITYTLDNNPTELGQQYFTARLTGKGTETIVPYAYAASGEDYSLFWFLAPPPLYIKVGT